MRRIYNQFDKTPANAVVDDTVHGTYERLHRHMLHYEALMYSSTGPILAICLPLGGVALGAGGLPARVQIFVAVSGAILALFALITAKRLSDNVQTYARHLKTIETETGVGHLEKYPIDATLVRSWTPNILTMRMLIFGLLIAFFIAAALANWLYPAALQASV
ncbi:MAG: hypothetical protein AAFR65_12485 [Pseudomonadota bacterium]